MPGTIFLCISYSLVFMKLEEICLLFVMAGNDIPKFSFCYCNSLFLSVLHVNYMFLTVIFQTFYDFSFVPLDHVSQNSLL
jgi:hypothetical protein